MDAFRFSIAWSRIFPGIYPHLDNNKIVFFSCKNMKFNGFTFKENGEKFLKFILNSQQNCIRYVLHGFADGGGEVNQAGIDHYNEVINALLAKGWLLSLTTLTISII